MEFSNGMKVEVCSNEEGYRGAWFEGTVVSNEGGGIHKVQHKKFENERNEPLVEDFHFSQIRPRPPNIKFKNWKVDDPVEIYDTYCWWTGVVSEHLSKGYYSIHFPEYGEKVYYKSDMRLRQEWHNGKWSMASCFSSKGHNNASIGKKRGNIEKLSDYVAQSSPVKRIRVKGLSEGVDQGAIKKQLDNLAQSSLVKQIRVKSLSEGADQGAIKKQLDNVAQNQPLKQTQVQAKALSEGAGQGVIEKQLNNVAQNLPLKRTQIQAKGLSEGADQAAIEKQLDNVRQNLPLKWTQVQVKGLSEGAGQAAIEKQLDNVAQNLPLKLTQVQAKGLSEGAGPSGVLTSKVSRPKVSSSSKGKRLGVRQELSDLRNRVTALENFLGVMQR